MPPTRRLLSLHLALLLGIAALGSGLPPHRAEAGGGAGCALPEASAALRAELLAGINAERRARGLPALVLNAALDRAAQGHACDNAQRHSISHDSADGSHLQQRLRRVGYDFHIAAENTGRGFATPHRAVEWWMNSPHHKDNMLLRQAREIGIGIALSEAPDSRLHWVIDLGTTQ